MELYTTNSSASCGRELTAPKYFIAGYMENGKRHFGLCNFVVASEDLRNRDLYILRNIHESCDCKVRDAYIPDDPN